MRAKMVELVKKLMSMSIQSHLLYYYFHCYMTKSVFFGCGVVHLNTDEIMELTRIYEQPLLEKLRLGQKFPRVVLYLNKDLLGIGLMKINTILEILTLKQYFGHTCLQSQTNDLINASLENLQIECGRNIRLEEIPQLEKWWNRTYLDSVFEACSRRGIHVERNTNFLQDITKNKTIMDYAVEYKSVPVALGRINQVRLYKGVLLPIEIVGLHRKTFTSCAFNKHEKSPLRWKFITRTYGVLQPSA